MLAAGKRPLTPNFLGKAGEFASWFWQPKWEGGGAWKLRSSSPHGEGSRRGGPVGSPRPRQHGCHVGVLSWRTAAPAFTVSLLDRRPVSGTSEEVLSVREVLREARFSCSLLFSFCFHLESDGECSFSRVQKKKKEVTSF